MEGLIQFLQDNPTYDEVWFNEKGEWCFSETNVFTIRKSREEILDEQPDKTTNNSKK